MFHHKVCRGPLFICVACSNPAGSRAGLLVLPFYVILFRMWHESDDVIYLFYPVDQAASAIVPMTLLRDRNALDVWHPVFFGVPTALWWPC